VGAASFDDGGTRFDDGGFGFDEGIGLNRRVDPHDLGTDEERLLEELMSSQFSRFRHFKRGVQKFLSRFTVLLTVGTSTWLSSNHSVVISM
jgi:hypothetical protein